MKKSSLTAREGGPTFSLRNRLTRALWRVVWGTLGQWTPIPFFRWRRWLLVLFGADIHKSARIYPGVQIWLPSNLIMHEHACMGPGVVCYSMNKIIFERYSLVSQRAHLCCGSHDIDSPEFDLFALPIVLRNNSWVAAEAFVGPGVTVGEGAVLGARACAFRDLKDWTVYAGCPARALRERKNDARGNS